MSTPLARGDLKFRLDGYKLKGSWALVRTRGWGGGRRDDGRSWLLIKHRDEWAGPVDIATFAPRSVKSDGDFADILQATAPAVWTTNPGAEGAPTMDDLKVIVARVERYASESATEARATEHEPPDTPPPHRRGPRETRRRRS